MCHCEEHIRFAQCKLRDEAILINRKAQAATELAVLGALIITIFAILINYSERLNRQQAYNQQAFRAALAEARKANSFASFTKVGYRRMANVSSPLELGQLQSFSGSARVLWQDGNQANPGVNKYQLNEETAIDIPPSGAPIPESVVTSNSSYVNTTDVTTTFSKKESGGKIVTTKELKAKDTLQADVDIDGKEYTFTHTLGEDGKYYPGDKTLERARSIE